MSEVSWLALSGIAGALLGAMFFAGLWWTVRKCLTTAHPAAWMLGSLLARVGLTLGGFYLVGAGHWQRLLACLLGFSVARLVAEVAARSTGDVETERSTK